MFDFFFFFAVSLSVFLMEKFYLLFFSLCKTFYGVGFWQIRFLSCDHLFKNWEKGEISSFDWMVLKNSALQKTNSANSSAEKIVGGDLLLLARELFDMLKQSFFYRSCCLLHSNTHGKWLVM